MPLIFRSQSQLLAAVSLVVLCGRVFAQTDPVSLNVRYGHTCVGSCVYRPGSFSGQGGIEQAIGCAAPVANNCYCPTAATRLSAVESYVTACASSRCGSGDIPDDVSAMKSIYASYCSGAGVAQPMLSTWYIPASTTAGGGATGAPTTTELTLVTQTAPTRSGSAQGKCPMLLGLVLAVFVILQVRFCLYPLPYCPISSN
jgi:hypothetical protein